MATIGTWAKTLAILRGQIGDLSHIDPDLRRAYVRMKLLARFPFIRDRASGRGAGAAFAADPGAAPAAAPGGMVTGNAEQIASDVCETGLSTGLALSDAACAALQRYAETEVFHIDGPDGPQALRPGTPIPPDARYGVYYNASVRAPEIGRLSRDPVLLEAAARYLKDAPRFIGATLWWCFAGPEPEWLENTYSSHWHYDIDDYRSVKFFFYLTDVADGDGAHCYLRGTHRARPLSIALLARRFTDRDVRAAFPDASEVTVTGPAGTGFAIDNFGLHRGLPCTGRHRLALEVCFGISAFDQLNDIRPELEENVPSPRRSAPASHRPGSAG